MKNIELRSTIEVDLEKYIQDKVDKIARDSYFRPDTEVKEVDKKNLIIMLQSAKKDMKDEHNEALKLYEKAIARYEEVAAKFFKSKKDKSKLNDPPQKPKLPISYHKLDGYINMFDTIVGDKITLKIQFLEKIFLELSKGIEDIEQKERELTRCISGSVCYFVSNAEGNDYND